MKYTEPALNAPISVTVPSSSLGRTPALSSPDLGVPRESIVVGRYLPDPSLRYSKLPLGSGSLPRFLLLMGAGAACLVAAIWPVWRLILDYQVTPTSLAAPVAIVLGALLFKPAVRAGVAMRTRAFFGSRLKTVSLGLDRAVFQPGNTFRYEVQLPALRPLELQEVQVRLVFWESWRERRRIRFLHMSRWVTQKQGHDLVRHLSGVISLLRDQHAVIRGEFPVPPGRPAEHHRGDRKHMSYVNITVTLGVCDRRGATMFRADCPRLITFPWM